MMSSVELKNEFIQRGFEKLKETRQQYLTSGYTDRKSYYIL